MSPTLQLKTSGRGFWTDHARRERNLGFYVYGQEFYRSALKTGSPLVKAYLLGHALELLFKTYLLTCGAGERELRGFGHDVQRLLKECRAAGLNDLLRVSSELEADLGQFSAFYKQKDLEYFSILHLLAPPRLPPLTRLVRFAGLFARRLKVHLSRFA
jgi:hypothetical protein